ncbi:hypothetical protein [Anaerocolumna sp.]|nr:hypothetical protein [Anaerocolumna sp.]
MKKRDSKYLLRKIRKYILWGDVYRYGIAIILLLVPVLLAASSMLK